MAGLQKCRALIMLSLFLLSSILLAAHVMFAVDRYQRSSQRDKMRDMETNPGPTSITICHNAPFSYSRFCSQNSSIITALGISGYDLIQAMKNRWTSNQQNYDFLNESLSRSSENESWDFWSANTYAAKYWLGHNPYESIIQCTYGNEPCSFDDFKAVILPGYGNCFSFTTIESDKGNDTIPVKSTKILNLYLADLDSCSFSVNQEKWQGFAISIHSANQRPIMKQSIPVQNGYQTDIKVVRKASFNAKKNCGNSPTHLSECILDPNGEILKQYSYDYTATHCTEEHLQERVIKACGCYSEKYALPCLLANNVLGCHDISIDNLLRNDSAIDRIDNYNASTNGTGGLNEKLSDEIQRGNRNRTTTLLERVECHDNVAKQFHLNNMCQPACESVQFAYISNRVQWPEESPAERSSVIQVMENHLKLLQNQNLDMSYATDFSSSYTSNEIQKKFAKLTVIVEAASIKLTEDSGQYSLKTLFLDVSGIAGWWIVLGVLTLLELVGVLCLGCKNKKLGRSMRLRNKVGRATRLDSEMDTISSRANSMTGV